MKRKIISYPYLISIVVLSLFLFLLYGRMYLKMNDKLSEICRNGYILGGQIYEQKDIPRAAFDPAPQVYLEYVEFYQDATNYIDNYEEDHPKAKDDRLYLVVSIKDDLDAIRKGSDNMNLHIKHLQHLYFEHYSSLFISLAAMVVFVCSSAVFVFYIFKNKPKYKDIINTETSN